MPPVEGVAGGGTGYGWNDCGFHMSASFLESIDPAQSSTTDLLHVWCLPNTANIGNQEMPQPLEPISLLVARNERESKQIALRPKLSWGGPRFAGSVKIQCSDLCSSSSDRLIVGHSLTLRLVVPILGVPDALMPLDMPVSQLYLFPGETTSIWVSIDVPVGQPPGQYEGEICITAVATDAESSVEGFAKLEKDQLYQELKNCIEVLEPLEGQTVAEVAERVNSASSSLKRILLTPIFSDVTSSSGDIMDEDIQNNIPIQVKISVAIWDFTLPLTPSLPAVFGISETVIEDRFEVKHSSAGWYDLLDKHFDWLLQFRISPFFCRWGESMRVLAYTCPWPADRPKSDAYYSNPKLAAYAVPYVPILSCNDAAKDLLQKEIEILKTKEH